MSILFEKHPLTVSLALAPGKPREADELDRSQNAADAVLTIGLINNMPDSALQATERQFIRLLEAAAGNNRILLHCFSLPSVKRSPPAKSRVDKQYADIADLGHLKIDGLIVTGAEPKAATLPEEPFWPELAAIIDWAEANTRSTIWSCLAAHAAVLHFDGIERQRLNAKCSGVFDCAKTGDHWLTENIVSPLKVSHSRLNAVRKNDLVGRGYRMLTESPEAGIDVFAKQLRSHFIFFQGHPEYDTLSLQREYLRDITRFIAGERDTYPTVPSGYFDVETEGRLAFFQKRASAERKLPLSAELPGLRLRRDVAAETAPTEMFRNWLGFLSGSTAATLQPG